MWIYCCHASIGPLFMLLIWPVMLLPIQKHACHLWLKQCGAIAEGVLKSPVQKDHHGYMQACNNLELYTL